MRRGLLDVMRSSDFGDLTAVRLRDAKHYAKGGLARAADKVRGAGRYGDDHIIHVNSKELAELRQAWGEPTTNPETGQPEFFLEGVQDFFKDNSWLGYALPFGVSMLAPGIGGTIGGTVNDTLGLGLGSEGANALGGGLLGAGIGAITGKGKGALIGALTGGLGGYFSGYGKDTVASDIRGSSSSGSDWSGTGGGGSGGSRSAMSSGIGGLSSGILGKAVPALMIAGALSQMGGGSGSRKNVNSEGARVTDPQQQAAILSQQQGLSQVPIGTGATRIRKPLPTPEQLRNYGYGPEYEHFERNQLARGGRPVPSTGVLPGATAAKPMYVSGPGGGRDDTVPAMLSDGEYVMTAEDVALLGDGSSKEGAKRLDKFRQNLRRHKGGALAKGKISPAAKQPESYVPKGILKRVV